MGARLTDSELAARVRTANQRRAARLLERQKAAGKVALTIWINATTKNRIDAARHGATLNEAAERLLLAALNATTTTPATNPTAAELTVDMFDAPAGNNTTTRDELMTWIGERLNEGLSGAEVARQLNASGKHTANGAAFTGQNLLRDYRAWTKNTGAASEPQPT